MNYTQYLQSGDTIQAPMSDEQALAHQKQKDNEAAEAIKANPSVLDKAIQDYGEEAPAFIKHMIDVAAENQDEELLEILKPYAEKFNIMSFRCGGKVRAKIKKACGGKKMEKGGQTDREDYTAFRDSPYYKQAFSIVLKKKGYNGTPTADEMKQTIDSLQRADSTKKEPIKKQESDNKNQSKSSDKVTKGGCGCKALKKIGGRLIEVDCNGIPVIKAGDGTSMPRINEIAWHNKRYSKDEIKKIQAALNRQALDKQISVDGIFGQETLNAIRQFQQQHAGKLKVDGLAGDKTISALGISGISDSRIGQTRLGTNQARDNSPVSARDEQLRNYYNSDEVWRWLQNASNARGQYADRYNQMANEALKYLSPERASRLRYIANIFPDEYDADTVAQHNFAKEKEYGINMFKNAMANGQIRTAADYDNWMNKYHLSKEEMAELMLDPESITSSLVAGVRADNGRVNSQKAQANQLAKDVATAESKVGVGLINSLTPFSEALYGTIKDIKDQGISSLRPDKWLYNRLNNTILSGYTGGSPTYLTDIVPSTGNDFVDYAIDVATAPESWIGLGKTKTLSTKFQKPTYYKTTVKAGDVKIPGGEFYGGYIEANPFNRTRMELHNYVKDPVYWKKGHNAGDLKSRGKLKFNYLPSEPYKVPGVHGVQLEYPNQMVNLQEVPSYDKGISYAPYLGYNRSKSTPVTYTDGSTMLPEVEVVAQRKKGGIMNYKQYMNLK